MKFSFWKIILIWTLIYIFIISSLTFLFSNKLTDVEYGELSSIYIEMRRIEPNIKSDFYVNHLLKVLDKRYIQKELRKDALIYSLTVTDTGADLYLSGRNFNYIYEYVDRCFIPFSKFSGMSFAEDILNEAKKYYSKGSELDEDLTLYQDNLIKSIDTVQQEIKEDSKKELVLKLSVIFSYVIFIVLSYAYLKKKKK